MRRMVGYCGRSLECDSYTTGGGAGFIGGGEYNVLTGNDTESAIVGGGGNQVTGGESAIVGGSGNSIAATDSLIGGGEQNTIAAAGDDGAIVGGNQNTLSGEFSFLGGGTYNNLAAFGVGEDDKHITSIDEDGVALAAIKALHSENAQLRAQLASTNARLARLTVAVARLSTR